MEIPIRKRLAKGLELRLACRPPVEATRSNHHQQETSRKKRKEVFIMRIGKYESSSDSSHVGTAITFLLIGLGAGALTGLLLAPKSGKLLRRDLQRGYDDAKDTLGDWADEAKERVSDAKDTVREVSERVRDVASRGINAAADLRDAAREKVEPLRRAINRG